MKCELLAEHNLALMLDFIDDENTKYDEDVLKAFLNEKNAYGYIAADYEDEKLIIRNMETEDARIFTDELTAQGWHPDIAGYMLVICQD